MCSFLFMEFVLLRVEGLSISVDRNTTYQWNRSNHFPCTAERARRKRYTATRTKKRTGKYQGMSSEFSF